MAVRPFIIAEHVDERRLERLKKLEPLEIQGIRARTRATFEIAIVQHKGDIFLVNTIAKVQKLGIFLGTVLEIADQCEGKFPVS